MTFSQEVNGQVVESSYSDSPCIGYHFIAFFCVTFGIQGLGGCCGETLLVKGIGAALTIIGAILIRLAYCAKCDKTERFSFR